MADNEQVEIQNTQAPSSGETPKEEYNNGVRPADFNELKGSDEPKEIKGERDKDDGISRVLDIPVTVSVELGRTRMVINDLLQLGHGSVVELEKIAGEPMDIFVNDRLVARGEVVVINEKFGVRLTDIVSPMERIKQLKK